MPGENVASALCIFLGLGFVIFNRDIGAESMWFWFGVFVIGIAAFGLTPLGRWLR